MTELYRKYGMPMEVYNPYIAFRTMFWDKYNSRQDEKVEISIGREKDGKDEFYEFIKFKSVRELKEVLTGIGLLIGFLVEMRGESLSEWTDKSIKEVKDAIETGYIRANNRPKEVIKI